MNIQDETCQSKDKPVYQGPNIVDVGTIVTITGAIGTPVRDNPLSDNPAYYNANPVSIKQESVELDE